MFLARRSTFGVPVLLASLAASWSAFAEPTKQECISASESAQELRRTNKLGDARSRVRICVAKSCPGPVREDCTALLHEIDSLMPSIVFEGKDAAGNALSAVKVSVDGSELADHLDGTPLNVDPGQHTFRFEVDGAAPVERNYVVRASEKDRHEAVVIDTATAAPKWPAYAAFGVGGAGLVVGVIFTGFYLKAKSDADTQCQNINPATGNRVCPSGVDPAQALTSDTIGLVVGFAIAAVGGGVGAILLLTSSDAPAQRATSAIRIRPKFGLGSVGVEGRF